MQNQIMSQADTIRWLNGQISRLETENRMQAERIAGLEAVLYAAGVLDKDAVLGANPATIHLQATDRPELLGFPVIVMGSRVKVPKAAFIRFMRGG